MLGTFVSPSYHSDTFEPIERYIWCCTRKPIRNRFHWYQDCDSWVWPYPNNLQSYYQKWSILSGILYIDEYTYDSPECWNKVWLLELNFPLTTWSCRQGDVLHVYWPKKRNVRFTFIWIFSKRLHFFSLFCFKKCDYLTMLCSNKIFILCTFTATKTPQAPIPTITKVTKSISRVSFTCIIQRH